MKRIFFALFIFAYAKCNDNIIQAIQKNDLNYLQKVCCNLAVSQKTKSAYLDQVKLLVDCKKLEAAKLIPENQRVKLATNSAVLAVSILIFGAKTKHYFYPPDFTSDAARKMNLESELQDKIRANQKYRDRLNLGCVTAFFATCISAYNLYQVAKNLKIDERKSELKKAQEIEQIIKSIEVRQEIVA